MSLELKKTAFLSGGTKPAKAPRQIKVYSGADPIKNIYYMIFGPWGSGKTHALADLLLSDNKIFVMSTDSGGANGLNTVRSALKSRGSVDKLSNLRYINLDTKDDVEEFLDNPIAYYPALWEWSPDFLVWEGFSNFQQNYVKIEYETDERIEDQRDWDRIKNLTVRPADKFCKLSNPLNPDAPLHKILTCQENVKSYPVMANGKQVGNELRETRAPLLQGAGGKHVGAIFDVIIRTTSVGNDGEDSQHFYYLQGNENLAAKKRFKLPAKMPADFSKLHAECLSQLDI